VDGVRRWVEIDGSGVNAGTGGPAIIDVATRSNVLANGVAVNGRYVFFLDNFEVNSREVVCVD
jgi:hypothetical protein